VTILIDVAKIAEEMLVVDLHMIEKRSKAVDV
jgi:hypothetical protein